MKRSVIVYPMLEEVQGISVSFSLVG